MKPEQVKEKHQTELKWASYYFIGTIILSFLYSFIQILIFNQIESFFGVLILLNLFIFTYCSYKCLIEIQNERKMNSISKTVLVLNLFLINYLFFSLINLNGEKYIIPKREFEIEIENENTPNSKSNFLRDGLAFIKLKYKT
ncbi:MAG: hypothetical protein A3G95_09650 [Flavobacteria bacterium RIFCSPLOWO2_12_FULL_31_7]|nr:MAG: hypothetical protein A3G95_09650 [Flavobacteria bacterium RIFCSPLOWO2_12_FULL_31_7]